MKCPDCGAPLSAHERRGFVLCLYCHAALRVKSADAAGPGGELSVERHLEAEIAERAQQHLLEGRRERAMDVLVREGRLPEADADDALESMVGTLTLRVVRGQMLNPMGWAFVAVGVVGAALGLAFGVMGPSVRWGWLALAAASTLWLLPWLAQVPRTLSFLAGVRAPAEVQKVASIGAFHGTHLFLLVVRVTPADGAPFDAEMKMPVREQSISKLRPGTVLEVRYRRSEPSRPVFSRVLRYAQESAFGPPTP